MWWWLNNAFKETKLAGYIPLDGKVFGWDTILNTTDAGQVSFCVHRFEICLVGWFNRDMKNIDRSRQRDLEPHPLLNNTFFPQLTKLGVRLKGVLIVSNGKKLELLWSNRNWAWILGEREVKGANEPWVLHEDASLPEDKVASLAGLAVGDTFHLLWEGNSEFAEYSLCVRKTDTSDKVNVPNGRLD